MAQEDEMHINVRTVLLLIAVVVFALCTFDVVLTDSEHWRWPLFGLTCFAASFLPLNYRRAP